MNEPAKRARTLVRLQKAEKLLALCLKEGYLPDRADWTPPIDAKGHVVGAWYLLRAAIPIMEAYVRSRDV